MKIKHSGDCTIYCSPICDCGALRKMARSVHTNEMFGRKWGRHLMAIYDVEKLGQPKPKKAVTKEPKKMSRVAEKQLKELMQYINNDLGLLGLLYDLNMLPECVKEGSPEWRQMILISLQWREAMKGRTAKVAKVFTAKA